jgi:hypothetical protein
MRGTHVNLSTRCVRYRLVASLLTSCNNVNIFSSCYKVVTHNLLNYRRITSCWNSKSHLLISSWYYVLQTKTWTKLTLCSIRDNSVCVTPSHFSPTTADRTGDDCLDRILINIQKTAYYRNWSSVTETKGIMHIICMHSPQCQCAIKLPYTSEKCTASSPGAIKGFHIRVTK